MTVNGSTACVNSDGTVVQRRRPFHCCSAPYLIRGGLATSRPYLAKLSAHRTMHHP